jgi:integrase
MATISTNANDLKRLMFTDPTGERKTIYLGKCSNKDAQSFKLRVEELLAAKCFGTSPDMATLKWVASISTALRTKLSVHGLIDVGNLPVKAKKTTVDEFLKTYVEKRKAGMKPGTVIIWETAINDLVANLPSGIAIQDITEGHAADWLDHLKRKLSLTTVYKRIAFARQFFGYAKKHKLIRENPFLSISIQRPKPKSNVEVTRKSIDKLFKHCDPTWKAIVSLSRYGGLRCPSEVLSLKWEHIDFTQGTMAIPEPKNEHHDGRGIRLCPLFPEVREALEALPRVDEWVIDKPLYREAANTGDGWKNSNLRTQFLKQLAAAKVKPWKRLFHSMRASRQTEIELEFGLPAACAWLGNTESVAKESYLMVFEKEWIRATQKTTQSDSIQPDSTKSAK